MTVASDFNFFLPISKVEKQKDGSCIVSGYASTPALDLDGEIVSLDAVKKALPGYWQWRNIREMHQSKAVGVAKEANVDDKGLFLTSKIVDPGAVKKCIEGVYKGYSIGGKKLDKVGDTITKIDLIEISIVDRPANPECRIDVHKKADSDAEAFLVKLGKSQVSPAERALDKIAKAALAIAKANNPPAARDGFSLPAKSKSKCAAHGEVDCTLCAKAAKSAPVKCAMHGTENCELCAGTTQKGGDTPDDGSKPYGDVEYADPGYQSDKKKRYPLDTEDHVRAAWNYIHKPKNAGKYTSAQVSSIKSKIVSAWKSKIDSAGPPAAKDKAAKKLAKLAKREVLAKAALAHLELSSSVSSTLSASAEPSFLTLSADKGRGKRASATGRTVTKALGGEEESGHELDLAGLDGLQEGRTAEVGFSKRERKLLKRMGIAGQLSYCFDSIRSAQRSLLMEAKLEGGDMKDKALAAKLGTLAQGLAGVIGQKAEHEGSEALDYSDADDLGYYPDLTEVLNMSGKNAAASGGDLGRIIAEIAKRASVPSRAQRLNMAKGALKKARGSLKDLEKSIRAAHAMHKAAFLAKAAKKPKNDGDADDFDHQGAMEKLQKAFNDLTTVKTMVKGASAQLKKAASRSGQRGQEVSDGNSFYSVPAGVKDLSPSDLATASPGGEGRGSEPFLHGMETPFPGKSARKLAKQGLITAEQAELMAKTAVLEAENKLLKTIPAQTGKRPFAFDLGAGGSDGAGATAGNILADANITKGVDLNALRSGDEDRHKHATARLLGNMLVAGKGARSVFDSDFHGTVGGNA